MTHPLATPFIYHLRADSAARNTIRVYTSHVTAYLAHLSDQRIEPATATRDDVARYLGTLRANGFLPRAVESQHKAVKRFHRFLCETGRAKGNPLAKRIRIPLGRTLPRFLTEAQAVALIESVTGTAPLDLRDRALLEMLYATGLRASELCDLQLASFDRASRSVRVMGKGRVEATVYYGESAEEALGRYLAHGRPRLGSSPALWMNCFGGPLRYSGLHRMVKERGRALGMTVRPHMLRHSFATHLMQRGAHLRVIQELMRHASIVSTQIYTHLDDQRLSDERRKYHPRG